MGKVLDLAEKLWSGEATTADHNPLTHVVGFEELAPDLAFISSFANVSIVDGGEQLALIDTGSPMTAPLVHGQVRSWRKSPVAAAVYTHGHIDHVFGVGPFDREARDAGREAPTVYAHEAVAPRFDRYRLTAGYNGAINARQFRVPGLRWPTDYRYPDVTYRDHHRIEVGDATLELHHDRGETDDHTWVWWADRKVLFTGDLFIWASPNCGNPQKAQRYPREWADALDKMAALEPELLLPGHGPPIVGAQRVREALTDTSRLLRAIHDAVVAMMNDGARLDDILHGVELPSELLERPYLRPVYDEPAFIVRNLWRLYGGWHDGNPARLKPAPDRALAGEVARMAGGPAALGARARELAEAGDHPLACQLAEWAWQAAPDDSEVRAARADVYRARIAGETSLMARSIFDAAARESDGGS